MTEHASDPPPADAVTYLVACHNQTRYVGDCLASLRAQTDGCWRAVVCDDASDDGSAAAVAAVAEPRVRLVRNAANRGYIGTLRRLIAEAETDVVALLDADDALEPGATAALRRAHADHPDAGLVYSRFGAWDEALARPLGVFGGAVPPGGTCLWHATAGHVLSFRRRAYERTAGLDDRMLYAEDRDLVYKLEEVGPPVFVDAVLYRYRQVPGSQSQDPAKREVGARNTRRARSAALARRGVRGAARAVWETMFLADYLAYSARPPAVVRALARRSMRTLGALAARPWAALGR